MGIPDYQSIMLPLLRFSSDGNEHSLREAIEDLALKFRLSDKEKRELLLSGQQPTFDNRVAWARTYTAKAGLLEPTRRGYFRITNHGQELLAPNSPEINVNSLEQFPEFIEFRTRHRERGESTEAQENLKTPAELLNTKPRELIPNILQMINGWQSTCRPRKNAARA